MNMMRSPDAVVGAVPQPQDRAGPWMSPLLLPGVVLALDIAAVVIAAIVAAAVVVDDGELSHKAACVMFVCVAHAFLGERAGLFSVAALMRSARRIDDLVLSFATGLLLFFSVALALDAGGGFSLGWTLLFAAGAAALAVAFRAAARLTLARLARRGLIGRSMVVLGTGEQSRRFLRHLSRSQPLFTEIVGVFHGGDGPADQFEGHAVLGDVDGLLAAARARRIDDVVIAMPWNADRHVAEIVERLKELPVNVYLSTDLVGFEIAFRPVAGASELPLFEVVQRPISGWGSALKTIEDYVLATLLLIAISPLMLAIASAIKIDSAGPVLFRQARLGFNNHVFQIYKFRSMHHGSEAPGVVRQAIRGDPRVTRVGRFIRATSLDELPQLLNVLDGSMSLVGPRPHAVSHNEEYGRQIRGYFARHKVKPGITGWAQVNGLRGETETLEKMAARIRHDVYYAENWSILLDLRILVMTAFVVLLQKSAY